MWLTLSLFPPRPSLSFSSLLFCLQVGWQRLLALRGAQVEESCLSLSVFPHRACKLTWCFVSTCSPLLPPLPPLLGGHCAACFNHRWLFLTFVCFGRVSLWEREWIMLHCLEATNRHESEMLFFHQGFYTYKEFDLKWSNHIYGIWSSYFLVFDSLC